MVEFRNVATELGENTEDILLELEMDWPAISTSKSEAIVTRARARGACRRVKPEG
jgi:hypothetical protein